jgi:hypothetical protein
MEIMYETLKTRVDTGTSTEMILVAGTADFEPVA